MNYETQIRIVSPGYKFGSDVFIFRRVPNGKTEIMHGDKWDNVEPGVTPQSTIFLEPHMLQAFADELANIGIKPQKSFIEGKLDATEKHLEDMRKLVFK